MRRGTKALGVAALVLASCRTMAPRPEPPGEARPLSDLAVDPEPWMPFQPNSDQRQPVYLGARPVEMALEGRRSGKPALPEALRKLGDLQLAALARRLAPQGPVELEAWPAEDDYGWQLTWACARWRDGPRAPWRWLDKGDLPDEEQPDHDVPLLLPILLDPSRSADWTRIFEDFLNLKSLYDRPLFGECLWTSASGDAVFAGWLPLDQREERGRSLPPGATSTQVCRVLRQPARLDDRPLSWILRVEGGRVHWPEEIAWIPAPAETVKPEASAQRIQDWPADFTELLRRDLMECDGETEALFPKSGRRLRFTRKSSAQQDHQLEEMVQYLEERYATLGIQTRRQDFEWRGLRQTNLVAVLPGSSAEGGPLLMADHYDTAFADTLFKQTGQRVAVPGADDNCSATVTLLRAAELLRGRPLGHELWLVHLTGEEYPGDDLGARHLVTELLREKRPIRGLVLLDMIAFHPGPARGATVQLNAGDSPASVEMARVALGAAADVAPELNAVFRARFDRRSYLYNTDGHIFTQAGYPVLLVNEHINGLENLDRPDYHELSDKLETLNWDYFTAVSKLAIETVARLADAGPRPAP